EVPPKTKASVHKKKADSDTTPKEKPPTDPKGKRVKQTGKMTDSGKQKQPATDNNSKQFSSGDGVNILSKVPDEQVHEKTGIDEGAGDKPEVPDVPKHHSNSEEESWTFSDDDDDAHADEDDAANKESEAHDDDDDDDATESNDDEDKEGEVTNVALEGGNVDMIEADTTEDTKDTHVTLMAATPIKSKVEKYVTESLGAEVLIHSTNQPQTSYGIAASLSKLELKRILMDKMENKSIDGSYVQKNLYNALVKAYNTDKDLLSSYGDVIIIPTTREDKYIDEEPSARSNRGTKRRRSGKEAESSKEPTHKESMTTGSSKGASRSQPTDLNETTHLEFITGDDDVIPAREPDGTHSSFSMSLWLLPSNSLPSEKQNKGRLVIPFDHFINNDLEYLKGGSSSRKYTTSITKTKAADYGQVKWIDDWIPRHTWSVVPIDYDKYAYWVISLKIMKFFGYSHLEEITVHRQDDVLYKFREGDFKRLRRQDIEDILLLLVQGNLNNLSLDDQYALNVALRIYPDVQGIIYQDELNRNRLMHTDELYKFSDATLNHVRTTLNDDGVHKTRGELG
ncbi:hypothetical protein Tco_1224826, partial [Tanacetum coccineum]